MAIDNQGVQDRFKLSAALVRKREVISYGVNRMKTHPMQQKYGRNDKSIYLHAEISAIINALNHINKKDLTDATLYVYRVKRSGPFSTEWCDGEAEPCLGCQEAIKAFGIKRVVHSSNENNSYKIKKMN